MSAHKKITELSSHGHGRADWRAKAAAAQPCDARFPLPHTDLKPCIRICLCGKWRKYWRHTEINYERLEMISGVRG